MELGAAKINQIWRDAKLDVVMDEIEKLAGLSLWENNLDEISMKKGKCEKKRVNKRKIKIIIGERK